MTPSSIPSNWPRPLRLLCAALAQASGAEQPWHDQATALAQGMSPEDWDRFADLAIQGHRVAPVLAPVLNAFDMPQAVRARMDADIRLNAVQTLSQIAKTQAVTHALEAAGAQPLIFKGWPLADRLFGQINARHSGDIDIAIAPDDIAASIKALTAMGYRPDTGFEREGRLQDSQALAREGRDLRLVHPDSTIVELHWHLLPYRGWPDIMALPGAKVRQDTQAGPLTVLSDQANMLYLPIHGGLHMWTRLKWLADIAPLARLRGPDGLAEDMELARNLGLTRPVSIGLNLAARLLGSPLPPGMTLGRPSALERFWLDTITRGDMIPGVSPRYRLLARLNALRLARGARQTFGVIRFDTLRRWRWRIADMGTR